MKIKLFLGPIFVLAIFIVGSISMNCYTTFKHPKIYSAADSAEAYFSERVTFLDDCSSCHEQNTTIKDPHLQLYDYPMYEENYSWQYYYVIPWWMDEYYYENEQQVDSKNPLPAPQRRDFDRREVPSSPATASPNASGSSLSKPSTSEATSTDSPQPEPKTRHERRQEVSKESSKSEQSATPSPDRQEREKKETIKKEKK